MHEILEQCVRRLRSYATPGLFHHPHHAERAAAVAASIRDALSKGDIPRGRMILAHQLQLLDPAFESGIPVVGERLHPEPHGVAAASPMDGRHLRGKYYRIIRDAYAQVRFQPWEIYEEPGVAMIHRIWLGKRPTEALVTKIRACDLALRRIWRHPRTGRRVRVESRLWTDPGRDRSLDIPGVSIRDWNELVEGEPHLFALNVENFLRQSAFAFASDILRYLALCRFGGMYLGVRWGPMRIRETPFAYPQRWFVPTAGTRKVFASLREEDDDCFRFPHTLTDDGRFVPDVDTLRFRHLPDSEILYAGVPQSPLFRQVRTSLMRLIEGGMYRGGWNVLLQHRLARKRVLDAYLLEGEDLRTEANLELRKNPLANVGGSVTNVYPLLIALRDTGHLLVRREGGHSVFDLRPENMFFHEKQDGDLRHPMHVAELGILRDVSQTWLDIPLGYRPHLEQ